MKYPSFVEETTTTTGTGNLTLAGATDGHRALSTAVSDLSWVPYYLLASDGKWERGIGQLNTGAFVRSIVLENSLGTSANITLPTGTHFFRVDAAQPVFTERRGALAKNTSTGQSITAGSTYDVVLDSATFDTDSCFTASSALLTCPDWCDHMQASGYIWLDAPVLPTGDAYGVLMFDWTTVEDGVGAGWTVPLPFVIDAGSYYTDWSFSTPIMRRKPGTTPTVQLRVWNTTDQTLTLATGDAALKLDLLG